MHILISDKNHPAYPIIKAWADGNRFRVFTRKDELPGGDRLFLISCTEKLTHERDLYNQVFVIHESRLPKGRGWSPLAWQILEGANEIVFSMIKATDEIDAGPVVMRKRLILDGTELNDEIHLKSALHKLSMIETLGDFTGKEQEGEPTYYPRRMPDDSWIDVHKSIADQFDLLRICDKRFPAFFNHRGSRYEITLKKCAPTI